MRIWSGITGVQADLGVLISTSCRIRRSLRMSAVVADKRDALAGGAYPKRFQSVENRCALVLDGMLRVELE